jgi:DNA-binding SARP family transcriptional activator
MESSCEGVSPQSLTNPEISCSGETGFQQSLLELLQLMQSDYLTAKKQLEEVYQTFSQRETTVNRQLYSILEASSVEIGLNKEKRVVGNFSNPTLDNREVIISQDLALNSAMSLRAYCLGKFEVYLGQRKIDQWRSLKAKSLLKFLVAQRGKHIPKDVLMEALWPGYPPETGNNNLKAAVYALRQTISSSWPETGCNNKNGFSLLLFSEGKYVFNPGIGLWVDVEEFQRHWLTGQSLEKKGEGAQAISEYHMAERLYRGDYLEDDPYEEWTLLQREALKDTYLTILTKLANNAFRVEDYESCITYCQKILAEDSCHEDTYRQLMRCYNRLGQRHRALRWYELCAKIIKSELDFAPDNQTVELYQKLLRQEYI